MAEIDNAQNTPAEAPLGEQQNVGSAPAEPVKSHRDIFLEKHGKRHEGSKYDDDEALFASINDDYDADQNELGGYRENSKKISSMLAENPAAAAFLTDMMKGGHPVLALIKQYGDEFMDYFTDPNNAEEIAKAHKEYLDRVAKNKEYEEQYADNMEKVTNPNVDALAEKVGEEKANDIIAQLEQMAQDIICGKVEQKYIDMFLKADGYDKDIAEAAHVGEVKGRNANIAKNVELRRKGDGVPSLDSHAAGQVKPKNNRKVDSIFALAAQAK